MPTMTAVTVHCRHGIFTYFREDRLMGMALRIYGEYSEDEFLFYKSFLKPTDVVIEVGANIGTLTVPIARCCKQVFAFEPQPETFHLLGMNLRTNDIKNVDFFPYAVGATDDVVNIPSLSEIDGNYVGAEIGSGSCLVEQRSLDGMKVLGGKVDFIKMDCEGSELDSLKGAEKIITRNWPVLYVENNRPEKSKALVGWLTDHGYHCYWHRPPLYRTDNYRKYIENLFGDSISINMICCRDHHRLDKRWLSEEVLV